MKIEEGKFYRTRDGRKVGPMKVGLQKDVFRVLGNKRVGDVITWWADGCAEFDRNKHPCDLIAEWTDEPTFDPLNPPAFGELTDAQKVGLLLHASKGGRVDYFETEDEKWILHINPDWDHAARYRIKPEPRRETVAVNLAQTSDGEWYQPCNSPTTHRITFDTIDGKPVCDSVKMEEL